MCDSWESRRSNYQECHSEPIRYAQGKLREGPIAQGTGCFAAAQHDNISWDDRVLLSP